MMSVQGFPKSRMRFSFSAVVMLLIVNQRIKARIALASFKAPI